MKRTLFTVRVLVVLLLSMRWAASATAQDDHLKCYKVRDPQPKASYSADLGGLVAEPGCTIKVPAIMACVPATKTNVTPTPPGSGGTGTSNAFGCYKIKCPRGTWPPIALNDQFGTRSATPTKPKLLCAPVAPPTTTTTTTTTSSCPPTTTTITTTTTSSCPPATAFYCGVDACPPFPAALCPQGMSCVTTGTTCSCAGATIACNDPSLSGLTSNFCQWGTCPAGMTCGGVPKSSGCGFDCACQ